MTFRELNDRDLRRIRGYMRRASQAIDFETLEQQFVEEFERIIPSDTPCWNNFTVDLTGALSVASNQDYGNAFNPLFESFAETVAHHPVVAKGGWGSLAEAPRRLSDFETNYHFRENPLYREVYKHVDANYQIGYLAAKLSDRSVIFTINRKSSDFTEAQVQLLHLWGAA
ncbi:MAG: hypothetical protein ACSHYA_03130 [Opitutaceae bacterium]